LDLLDKVIAWLAGQNEDVYLVGGCVRDRLLGRPIYDLDVVIAGDGLRMARHLADHFHGAYYPLDAARSTGRAILPAPDLPGSRLVVDVARMRGGDRESAGLDADLADRDFSINALAAPVRSPAAVIDRHGGLADLEAGVIRPVSEASISNDPVRALRAVRLAAVLDFKLAAETETQIRRDGQAVAGEAGERVRDELGKLLAMPNAAGYVAMLDELGLLTAMLPELEPLRGLAQSPPHHLPALAHSIETVHALEAIVVALGDEAAGAAGAYSSRFGSTLHDLAPNAVLLQAHLAGELGSGRPRLVVLKLAALLHDVGKALSRSVDDQGRIRFIGHDSQGSRMAAAALRRLRFNAAETRLGESIVRHHMRPILLAAAGGPSARAVYRFFRDTGDAGVDVILHALADHLATYGPEALDDAWPRLVSVAGHLLAGYWEDEGGRVSPKPLIGGTDLQREFGLQPGPRIGELLELVREAQAAGELHTREQALNLVRQYLAAWE
jgi:tRNA nucleotidyltransferase/poly(A) polymerase